MSSILNFTYVAVVTLFKKNDDGSTAVDYEASRRYYEYLRDKGVKQVVIGGGTGEWPYLSPAERVRLLEIATEYFETVVFNVSHFDPFVRKDLVDAANNLAQQAIFLPEFYYGDMSPVDHLQNAQVLLASLSVPTFYYHIPGHTGVTLFSVEHLRELAKVDIFRGLKCSDGKQKTVDTIKEASAKLAIVIGSDPYILRGIKRAQGTSAQSMAERNPIGAISGGCNLAIEAYVRLLTLCSQGHVHTARASAAQEALNAPSKIRLSHGWHELKFIKTVLNEVVPGGVPRWVRYTADQSHVDRAEEILPSFRCLPNLSEA